MFDRLKNRVGELGDERDRLLGELRSSRQLDALTIRSMRTQRDRAVALLREAAQHLRNIPAMSEQKDRAMWEKIESFVESLDGPDEPAKGYVDNSSIERCEACHRPLSASLPHQCPHEAGTQGDGPFAAEVALDDVLDRIGQDISRESAIHALDELRKDGWLLVRSAEAGTQEDEGLLRDVTGSAGYVDRANAMGEALSFLARFPREGDEG